MVNDSEWRASKLKDFWGEIAPCEHVLQIYENNEVFINTLSGFVGDGINSGESTIVIATECHLESLENKLRAHGINVNSLIREDQYIPVNAEWALSQFMIDGWPDSKLFFSWVSEFLIKVRTKNRKVRAFGEMVAVLWAQGNNGATVQLEHLWNQFCAHEDLTLFCAYPKSGFTEDAAVSLEKICAAHSKLISGNDIEEVNILFRDV